MAMLAPMQRQHSFSETTVHNPNMVFQSIAAGCVGISCGV
jgi:hypothetical protein